MCPQIFFACIVTQAVGDNTWTFSFLGKTLDCYQPFIPVSAIVAKAGDYPELPLKAWTSRVVTSFLRVALQDVQYLYGLQMMNGIKSWHDMGTPAKTKLSEWLLAIEQCPW